MAQIHDYINIVAVIQWMLIFAWTPCKLRAEYSQTPQGDILMDSTLN